MSLIVVSGATFDVGDYSINTKYAKGSYLKGWLNISFEGQELDSIFTDSFDNEISLRNILENSSYDYNCSTLNCDSSYLLGTSGTTKTFTLNKDESILLGFLFEGNLDSITSASFNLTSNAQESTLNQIKLDLFDDLTVDTGNTNPSNSYSTTIKDGCFNESKTSYLNPTLSTTPYCQKIELDEAPGFNLGAWIKVEEAGSSNVSLSIRSEEDELLAECIIANTSLSASGELSYCNVNYLVPEKNFYYICAKKTVADGEYKVKGYIDEVNGCGFLGSPPGEPGAAYYITSRAKKFGNVGEIKIGNDLPLGEDYSTLIEEYILDKYGSLNCGTEKCIVPLRIYSFEDQTITIKDISLNHDIVNSPGVKITTIYNLSKVPATINSDYQKLTLDDLFLVPNKIDEYDYNLDLGDEEILSEIVSVEDFKASLNILKTGMGFPNNFVLTTSSEIKNYNWTFGDNSSILTTTNTVEHTYNKVGNYTLIIYLTDTSGAEFSEEFTIVVESPEVLIDSSITTLETDLTDFKNELKKQDSFTQSILTNRINIADIEQKISWLKEKQKRASESMPESELKEIIDVITETKIPNKIYIVPTAKLPFFPSENTVDLAVLEGITGTTTEEGKETETKNAILFWDQNNIHVLISTKKLSLGFGTDVEELTTVFDVSLSPKEYFNYPYYFIIEDTGDLTLTETDLIEAEGYKAIQINEDKTFRFAMKNVELNDLPLFISPGISELSIQGEITTEETDNRYGLLALIFLALILIGIVIYSMLQRWYKIKYETYLFKDRNNLYNIMVYVNNMKKQGIDNETIKKGLRKSGWSSEQIRYIMRKYEGKRTGMYELALNKVINPVENKSKIPNKNPVQFSTQNLQRDFKNSEHKP